jgi:hypothetical protein
METESESNNKKRLAFLGYSEFDKGYRGGILVTDEWGKRVEFRCTAPVRAESGATHTVRAYAITSYRG